MRMMKSSRRNSGFTLLETIIALAVFATAIGVVNSLLDRFSTDTKIAISAQQVKVFGDAANAYIKDNYSSVQGVITPSTAAYLSVPMLLSTGHLSPGFSPQMGFGQTLCALIVSPSLNRLQALVIAEGCEQIDDLSLGGISAAIGGSGGGIYSSDPSQIRGAMGGWSISTATFDGLSNDAGLRCDGSPGSVSAIAGRPVMALWFENGDTTTAFLARDHVPGRPELNEMNTPLVMNSVQIVNAACTRLGAIARDVNGAVVSCQSGFWKSPGSVFWLEPVSDYSQLNTLYPCAASNIGQTRVVHAPAVGSGPRAYTCNGVTWEALAIDNSGNLTIPGLSAAGKLKLIDTVVEGAACTQVGLVSKDFSGLILSCQSGLWKKQTPDWKKPVDYDASTDGLSNILTTASHRFCGLSGAGGNPNAGYNRCIVYQNANGTWVLDNGNSLPALTVCRATCFD